MDGPTRILDPRSCHETQLQTINWQEREQRPLSCLFLSHDLSWFIYNTSLKIPFYFSWNLITREIMIMKKKNYETHISHADHSHPFSLIRFVLNFSPPNAHPLNLHFLVFFFFFSYNSNNPPCFVSCKLIFILFSICFLFLKSFPVTQSLFIIVFSPLVSSLHALCCTVFENLRYVCTYDSLYFFIMYELISLDWHNN